jgi:hypothetical protein
MKYFILLFAFMYILPGCNAPGSGKDKPVTDTIPKVITDDDIRKERPEFPGYTPVTLDLGDTTRYLRIVLNNNRLIKTWMVYYDQPAKKWVSLTFTGKGNNNTVLLDTVFKNFIGINHRYGDLPAFYFAITEDEGKTWKPFHMSLAKISGCKRADLRLQKMGQLVVSNDFMNEKKLPSIAYIWQWSHTPARLRSDGITANLAFEGLCDALREIRVQP